MEGGEEDEMERIILPDMDEKSEEDMFGIIYYLLFFVIIISILIMNLFLEKILTMLQRVCILL
jgi:hypothetical protein